MRADRWTFRVFNLAIAAGVAGVLWFLFRDFIHDFFFLVILYWIMHVRDNASRLREIEARCHLNTDLLLVLNLNTQEIIEKEELLAEIICHHGFDEDDEIEEIVQGAPRLWR